MLVLRPAARGLGVRQERVGEDPPPLAFLAIRWSAAAAALVVALVHALVFILEPAAGRATTDASSAVFLARGSAM
ncbi:MAG: hypothetical protein IPK80_04465 [Nannocystis sp.]|nr:hypothetical protein [Nannocystis sp.]